MTEDPHTPSVAFATLGCRLNQVDSHELAARLEERGFRTVALDERADVVVVNTCAVTGRAEVSDRQAIRRAARQHPGARIVVTGCWAQIEPAVVASLREVDAVVGNADKDALPEVVERLLAAAPRARAARDANAAEHARDRQAGVADAEIGGRDPVVRVSDIKAVRTLGSAPVAPWRPRSRAFLKVQEGCQHRCSFCVVPLARGISRSLHPDAVVDQATRLVALGHAEVVLTGVDLGHYGADLVPRVSLAALVQRLAEVRGIRWVRLSSVLPAYFTEALIDLVTRSSIVAPHLHIPLQSGSDAVLRRMRRPYSVAMYRRLVERLADAIPRLGLGADVIVGFPGETEEDFAATLALADALPFSYLHVFGYSDRRGTEAAALARHVGPGAIADRSHALRALADGKSLAFRRAMLGQVEDAVVLSNRERVTGLTGNYVEVIVDGADATMRGVTRIRITGADPTATYGEAAA
jgi:threonylcarbamoyladenosine tRNA methylthiotransferase MtaB